MSKTQHFRDQHIEMLHLVKEITNILNVDTLARESLKAHKLLSSLFASLNLHLSMEDKIVYPLLLKSPDEKVRRLAKQFATEMGSIGIVLKKYNTKWENHLDIQNKTKVFIEETKEIFDALSKRIEKEDCELYNAFDKI